MTQTNPPTEGTPLFPLPTGDEIYDALMSKIDMELITVNIPTLDEKYKNESPADQVLRLKRYQTAYAEYDKAYAAWIQTLQGAVQTYRRHALRSAEERDRAGETQAMTELDAAIAA